MSRGSQVDRVAGSNTPGVEALLIDELTPVFRNRQVIFA
jgi:hypothetical protein